MSNTEILSLVQSINSFKAKNSYETSDISLGKLFDSCLELHDGIENSSSPSNDDELQDGIHACVQALEKCTEMVNDLELFSSNETVEELQTATIRYLMLPAILGSLTLKKQSKNLSERLKFVEMAEVYFRDFLLRCLNYEFCEKSLKSFKEMLSCESDGEKSLVSSDHSSVREKKIQQYRKKKELEDREKVLKPSLKRQDSEEYIREYYQVVLEKWVLTAVEESENLKREMEILKSMPNKSRNEIKEKKSEIKPLKPIILTRNELQKQVFGLGYPSIPVLTIEDFYRQRFEKMIEEQKEEKRMGRSVQGAAVNDDSLSKETEDIKKEELLEKDDPISLMNARQWDDWKDDNQRGSGNRYNKG